MIKKLKDELIEEKMEAKTDESSEKCFAFDISEDKGVNVSIFASDE
jgi:hypothetical protein